MANKENRTLQVDPDLIYDEPNSLTYAIMESSERGEDIYGPFDSVAGLMEALNA